MENFLIARELLALSESACADILRAARYGDRMRPLACARCAGHLFKHVKQKPRIDRCRTCGKDHSVTAGTALHGLKVPLGRVLATLVLLTRPGSISTRRLAILFGVHWKDAAPIAHKLRKALASEAPVLHPSTTRFEQQSIQVRWDPGTRPKSAWDARWTRSRLTAIALVDERTGLYVADIARKDVPVTLKNLVEDHLPDPDPGLWRNGPRPRLAYAAAVLRTTHQRVSKRWLRVYVRGLGWTSQAREPAHTAFQALRAVLRAPPGTWLALVPPRLLERAVA